jgi:hypothetical protein
VVANDGNGVPYWGRELSRRVEKIEDLKPDVMADNIKSLSGDVRSLRRAFYTFAFSVVASSILFAFTVFALLGKS